MISSFGLPRDWAAAHLGEFCSGRGSSIDPQRRPNEEFELYSVPSYDTGSPEIVNGRDVGSVKQEVQPNTVLLCGINPRINRTWVVREKTRSTQIASTEWLCFPPSPVFDSTFLRYYMMQYWFRDFLAHNASGVGGSLMRVKKTTLAECPVYVPSLVEQRAIVAKIEELFSELDKGIEQLQAVKQQLKQYRQAVLKAAFEGKLTAEWRSEQQAAGKLPGADELLEQIKTEREERCQQQLQEWKSAESLKKPARLKAFSASFGNELANLGRLPQGWVWVSLSALGDLARGKSRHRPRNAPHLYGGPYPFIQTGDVKAANRVVREYTQTYSDAGLAQSRMWPAGTLCITIAANIAESAFLGFDGCFPDSIVGFSADESLVNPCYVQFFLESAKSRIAAFAPATAQKNINLSTLENLVVPYCSLAEQAVLEAEIESRFSVLDELDKAVDQGLQKAEALRQSILKKAFEGRLLSEAELAAVRNDPEYEPADKLLERIQAERGQDLQPSKATRIRNGTRWETVHHPSEGIEQTESETK